VHDPVCGMTVDPAKARHRAEHAGQSYFFCGAKCREKFEADPARYIITSPRPRAPLTAAAGEVLWTCPMHPQIVRKEPGNCPICGMALEPMTPAGGEAVSPELRDTALLGRCRPLGAAAGHCHGRALQQSGA
jgi:P-type Cu+ transporter